MKRVVVCMILVAFGTTMVAIAGLGDNHGASVGSMGLIFSISQPSAEFLESEPIPLILVIKNDSQHERTIPSLFVNTMDTPIPCVPGCS